MLVGAQAVYLHTGDTDLAVAEYTTDPDFTVSPADVADAPLLADLLAARGFTPREHPGGWLNPDGTYVDIMVPEALAARPEAPCGHPPTPLRLSAVGSVKATSCCTRSTCLTTGGSLAPSSYNVTARKRLDHDAYRVRRRRDTGR